MSFAFLVDGGRPELSHEDYLKNVSVQERSTGTEWSGRRVATLVLLTVGLIAISAAIVTTVVAGGAAVASELQSVAFVLAVVVGLGILLACSTLN